MLTKGSKSNDRGRGSTEGIEVVNEKGRGLYRGIEAANEGKIFGLTGGHGGTLAWRPEAFYGS